MGGGPAGLMAAELLSQAGLQVHLFDAMPSVGRKFLLAGKGGLNLTHAEPSALFNTRFGARQTEVSQWLSQLDAQGVRDWAQSLGVGTFVGTSGRVFPAEMKAAPLLRAWLQRLRHPASGVPVQFHMRHRWLGWQSDRLVFGRRGDASPLLVNAGTTVLALGGASWPQLGSDGAWLAHLQDQGVEVAPLKPANCGFDVLGREGQGWTAHFKDKFAGHPLKSVVLTVPVPDAAAQPPRFERKGEFVITDAGLEGSLVYASSALLRLRMTPSMTPQTFKSNCLAMLSTWRFCFVLHSQQKRFQCQSTSTAMSSSSGKTFKSDCLAIFSHLRFSFGSISRP